MPVYCLHDRDANDLGLLRHPAPNLKSGDAITLGDGRKALVIARVKSPPHRAWLTALLEVLVTVKP